MLNNIFNGSPDPILGTIGMLATLTAILVQSIKNFLPSKIPTKIVTLIVALIITIAYIVFTIGLSVTNVVVGIFGGFVVALVSMDGFDTIKDILNRFKTKEEVKEEDISE